MLCKHEEYTDDILKQCSAEVADDFRQFNEEETVLAHTIAKHYLSKLKWHEKVGHSLSLTYKQASN